MSYSWENKVVLITGGATGIGAEVVRLLMVEGSKHVAVLDLAENAGTALQNELNKKYGIDRVKFFKCDVTNDEVLVGAFNSVKKEQGYIDVVVNNAGIMNDDMGIYKKEIEINVTALVTSTYKALELMRKDEGGRGGTVINTGSIAALTKTPLMPVYFATKSAVIQFSNCVGHIETYSRTGVRVLSVCYGGTDTSLLSKTKLGTFDKKIEETLDIQLKAIAKMQSPEAAARGLIDAYKQGESGSIWLIACEKPANDVTKIFDKFYDDF